ncbi:MAG TPA: 5-histidylcysteine sulfoxide synthase, partial [Campylobacterales bacterium]|nr:5-histidylcysteine sulfoxide synthase [Campylobacterales bacterium]
MTNRPSPIRTPLLHGDDPEAKRAEIRRYFHATYDRYESLFGLLNSEEAFYQKPDALRHPLIFYYGHTAVFFINKLLLGKLIEERIDPELESIFAVGVDEMSWDDLDEQHYHWPSVAATQAYRDRVREVVDRMIETLPLTLPITWDSPFWILLMGIEHENIHIETSSVLIRQLNLAYLQEHEDWEPCTQVGDAPHNELLPVPGGTVMLGQSYENGDYYGWDNEYGTHHAKVPDFKASKYLVSNAEFRRFVEADGYTNDAYWDDEGKGWRDYVQPSHPLFWMVSNEGYRLRLLTREIPLPENWPVEVNCHEANAFCQWMRAEKGIHVTLPTEDEYARLRDFSQVPPYETWGDSVPANIHLEQCASSTPMDRFAFNGFYDVIGNVWQWTRTPIYPFDGFEVHPIYDDFTVPTFDTQHNLIKGGSWISLGNEAHKWSRYAFRRHFFQHAGFRYVQSDYEEKVNLSNYEDDLSVSTYCYFGWGEESLGVANFPKTCADRCIERMGDRPKGRALDIGCAIGRSTFELAKAFDEVVGIDFSTRFIRHATTLQEGGTVHYAMPIEGEIQSFHAIHLAHYGLEATQNKVSFWQGDACNLKPLYGMFDLVFAGNLIDRLHTPRLFLASLA